MTKFSEISTSLEVTLKNSDLQSVTIDLAETLSDTLLKEGLLKEIPIIGTLFGVGKVAANIKDYLFLKKLLSFLSELKDIPIETRAKLITKIDSSKKYRTKIGEKLLYIVEKCDDYEKSQVIGILFKAFIVEKINYETFLRITMIVNNIMSSDLNYFVANSFEKLDIEEAGIYLNSGLFELAPITVKVEEINEMYVGFNPKKKFQVEGDKMSAVITTSGRLIREILNK